MAFSTEQNDTNTRLLTIVGVLANELIEGAISIIQEIARTRVDNIDDFPRALKILEMKGDRGFVILIKISGRFRNLKIG